VSGGWWSPPDRYPKEALDVLMRMQLTTRRDGAVTVVAAAGELTVPTAPSFLRQARLALAPIAEPLVAVDLSGVRRIDSSGFAALVALLRHVQRRSGEVCLVGLGAEARLLLEIMQLHLLFDVCEDVPAAVEAMTAARPVTATPARPRHLLGRIRLTPAPFERRAAS
jgi:anti-anti-sigma factor